MRTHLYHAASSDEEALWIDREHHLTLLAGVVSLGQLQRLLDALSQQRHLEPGSAAPNLYGDLFHSLLLSYLPVKKQCMVGCEASASARWLTFVGHLAIFRSEHRATFRETRLAEVRNEPARWGQALQTGIPYRRVLCACSGCNAREGLGHRGGAEPTFQRDVPAACSPRHS